MEAEKHHGPNALLSSSHPAASSKAISRVLLPPAIILCVLARSGGRGVMTTAKLWTEVGSFKTDSALSPQLTVPTTQCSLCRAPGKPLYPSILKLAVVQMAVTAACFGKMVGATPGRRSRWIPEQGLWAGADKGDAGTAGFLLYPQLAGHSRKALLKDRKPQTASKH